MFMDKLLEIFYVAARRRIPSRLFPVDSVIINNFKKLSLVEYFLNYLLEIC